MMRTNNVFFCPLSLLVSLSIIHYIQSSASYYDCRHVKERWPIDLDDNDLATKNFQDWINAWQHDKEKCAEGPETYFFPFGGIGAAFSLHGLTKFLGAFEQGKIYRPAKGGMWADSDPQNCTLHLQSLDCYFQSISDCGIATDASTDTDAGQHLTYPHHGTIKNMTDTPMGKDIFPGKTTDFCWMAKLHKKPTLWVMGQILQYMMRPRADIKVDIHARVEQVMPKSPSEGVIAVHYRVGAPDDKRKVMDLSEYMKAVAVKADEMKRLGKPVTTVYIATYINGAAGTIETITATYPASYQYKLLPVQEVPEMKGELAEVELFLAKFPEHSRRHFIVEFMSDLKMFIEADVFIGSYSSIYITASSMRAALHPLRPKAHTCMVTDHGYAEPLLVCEDNMFESSKIYSYYHGGHMGGVSW